MVEQPVNNYVPKDKRAYQPIQLGGTLLQVADVVTACSCISFPGLSISAILTTVATTLPPASTTVYQHPSPLVLESTTTQLVSNVVSACSPQFLGNFGGLNLGYVALKLGTWFYTADVLECCNKCFTTQNCVAYQLAPPNSPMAFKSFNQDGQAFCSILIASGDAGFAKPEKAPSTVAQYCPAGVVKAYGVPQDSGYITNYGPCIDPSQQ